MGKLIPILAMFRAEVPESRKNGSVEPFDLSVSLRMICCCKQLSYAENSGNVLKELGGKLPAIIGKLFGLRSKLEYPMFAKRASDIECRNRT